MKFILNRRCKQFTAEFSQKQKHCRFAIIQFPMSLALTAGWTLSWPLYWTNFFPNTQVLPVILKEARAVSELRFRTVCKACGCSRLTYKVYPHCEKYFSSRKSDRLAYIIIKEFMANPVGLRICTIYSNLCDKLVHCQSNSRKYTQSLEYWR